MLNYSNSKVTMELRDVLALTDENGKAFNLWDFDYPSYYEGDEKTAFEQKVIDHFLFHQIGVETPARFKHNFKTKIREIMPYYIQMYESAALMAELDDPFGNVDIVETYEETSSGSASASGSSEQNENRVNKRSDTPQGSIANIDNYLTEASTEDNDGSATSESSSESSGSVSHTLTRKGNQGVNTYAHDMKELRESFINVDMMIIGELRNLFLLIY